MTVDREHTEIFDQPHQMWAEGTEVSRMHNAPTAPDIRKLLESEGWKAYEIDVWYDTLQGFWRWLCKISKP